MEEYLIELYDRFSFDKLFRHLLNQYYFEKTFIKTKAPIEVTKKILNELGDRLYAKITEVVQSELNDITEQESIDYLIGLFINRTFDGYMTEIKTIYGQLEGILLVKIESAPDEWDRLFNVDFFIKINEKYIGLQIKPVSDGIQLPEIFKERAIQGETHKKFTEVFGGKVFYVFSAKINGKKKLLIKKL